MEEQDAFGIITLHALLLLLRLWVGCAQVDEANARAMVAEDALERVRRGTDDALGQLRDRNASLEQVSSHAIYHAYLWGIEDDIAPADSQRCGETPANPRLYSYMVSVVSLWVNQRCCRHDGVARCYVCLYAGATGA